MRLRRRPGSHKRAGTGARARRTPRRPGVTATGCERTA
ncbi:hypothetical protein BURPS305_4883 [Burkholderia pseudomallei 305]|nr:hypothetical protein BURPS305_4883 [Burkholderia pseudomallei 305]